MDHGRSRADALCRTSSRRRRWWRWAPSSGHAALYQAEGRDSWLIVPNLWGGIVGDPSAKKSPAWAAALKPLDRLIARPREEHQAALADYETARVVFDAQKDAIEDASRRPRRSAQQRRPGCHCEGASRASGASSGRATLRRYKTNGSTVEKLGELLSENPAGLLVLRDELVGLIATWEREGRGGERAFFLEGWNGNQSFDTDRIVAAYLDPQPVHVRLRRHPGGQADGLSGTGRARPGARARVTRPL